MMKQEKSALAESAEPHFPDARGRTKRLELPEWLRLSIIITLGGAIGLGAFYILRTAGY